MSYSSKVPTLADFKVMAKKSELKGLLEKAYMRGFLPRREWAAGVLRIKNMPVSEVESDIAYYTRLIASKEPQSKAA